MSCLQKIMYRGCTRRLFEMFIYFKRMKSLLPDEDINLSVVLHRSNDVSFEVRPVPILRENELDFYHILKGPTGRQAGYTTPFVLGNQASGVVVGIGVGVEENFKEGDRVVIEPGVSCHNCKFCYQGRYNLCTRFTFIGTGNRPGALCRYIAHPMHNCYKIPQHIGLDDGAMCTGIASAIHACKRASLDKNSKVAIIGTGFMGIAIVLTCKMMGIKNIFVIEGSEYRLNLSRNFGAEFVLKLKPHGDPLYFKQIIKEIMGQGPDVTFETVNSSDSFHIASTITRRGGQIVAVNPKPGAIAAKLDEVASREIDIRGVYNVGQSFQEALQYLKGGLINVKDLNPIVLPLEHALEAFTSGRVNQGGNVITLIECYNEHANKK
ncbi:sorbitol dehydrogenase-like isoform X3 [Rhodnius prolixus]